MFTWTDLSDCEVMAIDVLPVWKTVNSSQIYLHAWEEIAYYTSWNALPI